MFNKEDNTITCYLCTVTQNLLGFISPIQPGMRFYSSKPQFTDINGHLRGTEERQVWGLPDGVTGNIVDHRCDAINESFTATMEDGTEVPMLRIA